MERDPWVLVDFADGRISHINGVPCHMRQAYGRVMDHRLAAQEVVAQARVAGRNPRPQNLLQRAAKPPAEAGSLNLAGSINTISNQQES